MPRFANNIPYSLVLVVLMAFTFSCQQSNQQQPDARSSSDQNTSATTSTSDSLQLQQVWELGNQIKRPESAAYDPQRDVVYISNMAGGASEKNEKGYIAKISTDGKILEPRWVDGLNAPKGVTIHGNYLYTADIDELVKVNLNSGEIEDRFPAEEAKFLNDVTADQSGNVYVSDSRTNTVYRLSNGSFNVWVQGDSVQSPNGLYAESDRLVIAAGRKGAGKGRLMQAIDYDTKSFTPLGDPEPIGGIDAVQPNGQGGYFLTDWGAGKVMNYHPDRGVTTLTTISQGTADLDYIEDQKLIVLPVMMSDKILGLQVK